MRVARGAVFDVRRGHPARVADLRPLGRRRARRGQPQQLWIPAGFAHGFLVLSDTADFLYKTTDYYAPSA